MANRGELAVIRGARAGQAEAQLALGRLYLFGSAGLPLSTATALLWLQRAAQQGCSAAWMLIGRHVPFELALADAAALLPCYERAYQGGVAQAGMVLAKLVLAQGAAAQESQLCKALAALEDAAGHGDPEAQWLLARHNRRGHPASGAAGAGATTALSPVPAGGAALWRTRAADSGAAQAPYEVMERAWSGGDWRGFVQRALPLARALVRVHAQLPAHPGQALAPLAMRDVLLLTRCTQILDHPAAVPALAVPQAEVLRFRELAAHAGDRRTQLALGLGYASMDAEGRRLRSPGCLVNFKLAIRWLARAGEQGLAEAWFVLSRIYTRPEFAQRSVAQALAYLERAAGMGHRGAQLECGLQAWRTRRDGDANDVRAAHWLLQAAAQGSVAAEQALEKIADAAAPPAWSAPLAPRQARELARRQPLLAARLELAGLFGLTRAETLLLDLHAADCGHCLVIDIRAAYGRARRRLILLRTARERQALDRIARVFDGVDASPQGVEGNYRQRLYRLNSCLSSGLSPRADGAAQPMPAARRATSHSSPVA